MLSVRMNPCLVACLILAAVLYESEGCCTPDQWEGQIGEIGGLARKSLFRPPRLIGGVVALSYDATNKKVASSSTDTKGNTVKTIADFPSHRMYIIHDTDCKYFNFTNPFRKLCTDNATLTGTAVYGGGDATLAANTWSFNVQGLQGFAATTQDGCVPIGENYAGKIKRDYIIMILGYYNITTGIKDPSIFDPPAGCQPVGGEFESHLDNLDVSAGMKFVVKKFHEETPKVNDKYLRYEDKFKSENDIEKAPKL